MSPKTNTFADGLTERTSSMLDEIESKTVQKKVIGRGRRSKTLSEDFSRDKSHAKGSPSFT